jgi:hypothetical protein
MAYPWTVYKTWTTGEILTAADLNSSMTQPISNSIPSSIDDYSANNAQMQSTADPYPAGVESLASTIAGELERLRYVIAQITGETQWYIDPDVTLANIMSGSTSFAGTKNFTGVLQIADGTSSAPALSLASDEKTGIGSLHSRSLSFITQNGSGVGTEAFWINGSQQMIAAQNGSTAIPAYSFARDGGAGLACQVSDTLDLIAGVTLVSRFNQTTSSDSTFRNPQTLYYGGGSAYSKFSGQTTSSITTAKTILSLDEFCCFVLVSGNNGTAYFADMLITGFGGTVGVVSQSTVAGSPAARTYSISGNSNLQLAMASGTYATNAFAIQLKAR